MATTVAAAAATTTASTLTVLSANVHGFRTNVGELTHTALVKHADVVVAVETFLDVSCVIICDRITGYSHWMRHEVRGRLKMGENNIPLQDSVNILGVEVDSLLLFDRHLEDVARKASQKVTLLRRLRHLLDSDGLLTLYKAQVRPIMEYAPLTWMSSA